MYAHMHTYIHNTHHHNSTACYPHPSTFRCTHNNIHSILASQSPYTTAIPVLQLLPHPTTHTTAALPTTPLPPLSRPPTPVYNNCINSCLYNNCINSCLAIKYTAKAIKLLPRPPTCLILSIDTLRPNKRWVAISWLDNHRSKSFLRPNKALMVL
jgi:hypothetical protein